MDSPVAVPDVICHLKTLCLSLILLWYEAGPDTINHFVLALSMVYLVAVAMVTLQHITGGTAA